MCYLLMLLVCWSLPDKLRNVWNLAVYLSKRGSCKAALITRVPKLWPIKLILS